MFDEVLVSSKTKLLKAFKDLAFIIFCYSLHSLKLTLICNLKKRLYTDKIRTLNF